MAYYASLTSVVQLLEDVIHHNVYPKFLLFKYQIMKSLHQNFTSLLQRIQDYSSTGDQAGNLVEERIRDAARRARSTIEWLISDLMDSEELTLASNIRILFSARGSPSRRQKRLEEDLRQLELQVGSITEELAAIINSQRSENSQMNSDSIGTLEDQEGGGALSRRDTVVGFEEDLKKMKEQLLGESSQLQVVPIVGAGGIGKTTLARHAFDDDAILCHFDCRAWVKVSRNYNVKNVHRSIITSLGMLRTNEFPEGTEEEHIYKYLKGRKYLIVVDDIWETQVWDDVKRMFPDDKNGSRVILITRLLVVAQYPGGASAFIHEMKFLNEDQSWNLLQKRVFVNGQCPPELEPNGRLIASNCRGLPLAIVVIAGVLANVEASANGWRKIARNATSILIRNDEDFSKILSLSYYHLPHQLKPCFLYMGNLPDDHEISVSRLILLWIAEGFVLSANGSQSLEKVAEEYVEDLAKRNLVIVTKKRSNGQIKRCVVHDLLRNFCKQRSVCENFYKDARANFWFFANRILPAYGFRYSFYMLALMPFNFWLLLRFAILELLVSIPPNILCMTGLKLMRALEVPDIALESIPPNIFCLYHLKFLALHLNFVQSMYLPRSISKLQNLQTLIIDTTRFDCISLPPQIWKMPQLRHVIINRMTLPPVPIVFGNVLQKLESLQTLSTIEDFRFTAEAIGMIPNLRKLKIRCTGSESSGSWEVYSLNNLVHLLRLEELKIISPFLPGDFAYPPNLKKLTLEGCRLPWEGLTVVGSLTNLQELRLQRGSLVGEEWKAREGEFCSLKFLVMEMLDIKWWRAERIHFPCLEHLEIRWCFRLEEIPLEIGDIPTLKVIEVHGRESKLAVDSAKLILQEQRELGNEELQVVVGKT